MNNCIECGTGLGFSDRVDMRDMCYTCRGKIKLKKLTDRLDERAENLTLENRIYYIEKLLAMQIGDKFF
jgi:PHP family Zn ribbon phosphoesterase